MDLAQALANPLFAAVISGLVASAVSVFFGQRYAAKLSADAVQFAAETNRSAAIGVADLNRETSRLVERDKHRVAWRRALIEPFLETVMKRNDLYGQTMSAVELGQGELAQQILAELGKFEGIQRAGAFNELVALHFKQAIRAYWQADHMHFEAAIAYVANPTDQDAQLAVRLAVRALGRSTVVLFRRAEEYILERVDDALDDREPVELDEGAVAD